MLLQVSLRFMCLDYSPIVSIVVFVVCERMKDAMNILVLLWLGTQC